MLLQIVRGARLIVHLLVGLLLVLAVKLDWRRKLDPERLMSGWCQICLGIFNVRLQVNGTPLRTGRMTVANHVSWLDIITIGACEPTRFVAKSEIAHWPVAGWLANAAGTFYIRRGKDGARPLLNQLTPHLKNGGSIAIFPEGTTTDGRSVFPFHPRLFAAAIEAQVPVQPVALRYGLSASGDNIAPFIGDDNLVRHILRLLREPELHVEIFFCAPLSSHSCSRGQLASVAQQRIAHIVAQPNVVQRAALKRAIALRATLEAADP